MGCIVWYFGTFARATLSKQTHSRAAVNVFLWAPGFAKRAFDACMIQVVSADILPQLTVLCLFSLPPALPTPSPPPKPPELRAGFLHDLDPEGQGFPDTLGELADKLKAWRNRLQVK